MGRILLLGGSGFLGGHTMRAFEHTGVDEVVLVGHHRTQIANGATRIIGDLTDERFVRSVLDDVRPSAIVNCAGATSGSAPTLRRANVRLVATVLAAMRVDQTRPRLIQLGSSAEYGPVQPGRRVSETDHPRPVSAYGRTKLLATELVLAAGPLVRSVVLRVFNPVGAGAPATSLLGAAIASFHAALADGLPAVRLATLESYRDFVHVADVAEAVVAAAHADDVDGLIVNVGSGQATQVRQVVRELATIAGFSGRIIEAERGNPRSANVQWQQADIGLAETCLGWRPKRTLTDALRDAWKASIDQHPLAET